MAAARRRLGTAVAAGARPAGPAAGTDALPQIEHIVVLMMENHSYDNYLGMLNRGRRRLHARARWQAGWRGEGSRRQRHRLLDDDGHHPGEGRPDAELARQPHPVG